MSGNAFRRSTAPAEAELDPRLPEREIIERIAFQRNLSFAEAVELYRKQARDDLSEIRAVEERRKRAGNPVYKPRDDFTGGNVYTGQVRR